MFLDFHLVFTLPPALNPLAATFPRRLHELLFRAVSETLLDFAADPRHLGGTLAFTLVLHTWTQDIWHAISICTRWSPVAP